MRGIADQLVSLIERLCNFERLLRAEAKQPIGVALQFRQIVQTAAGAIRWVSDSMDSIDALSGTRPARRSGRLLAVGRQPHGLLQRFRIGLAVGCRVPKPCAFVCVRLRIG